MITFPDKLRFEDVGYINGERVFEIIAIFRYIGSRGIITVPIGTFTDGASIPKIFHSIMGPFGLYFMAAVIHDYLYSPANKKYDRLTSDLIFKEAMYNSSVPWYVRNTVYRAVRLFGHKSFRGKIQ